MIWPKVIGSAFSVLGIAMLCINILVLVCMVKGKMLTNKASPIYFVSAQNIFMESLQLIGHICYLGPAVFFQSWLFPAGQFHWGVKAFSLLFVVTYYHLTLVQMFIALNRFMIIVHFSYRFFTRTRMIIGSIIIYGIVAIITLISQFLSPCCPFSYDWRLYSYSYLPLGDGNNWSNVHIDSPLNILSSTTSFVAYSAIVWKVHNVRRSVQSMEDTSNSHMRRRREYLHALQFCLLAVFYTSMWMIFRVFPVVIGATEYMQLYSILPFMVIFNCSANASIYLFYNAEIRGSAKFLGGIFSHFTPASHGDSSNTATGSSAQQHQQQRHPSTVSVIEVPRLT